MTKDDSLFFLNNNISFKIYSVKVEHFFKKIVISNKLPINRIGFHKRDGFPIRLSIESFLVIDIECSHKVFHEFKIPIESTLLWKIENGIKDGVFKHGYGVGTKYSDNDINDCVVYFPPRDDGIEKNSKVKEISILIDIKTNKKDNEIYKNSSLNNSIDINNIVLWDFGQRLLLTLHIKQRTGFLNKMHYEISFTVKKMTKEQKPENILNPLVGAEENGFKSNFIYRYQNQDNNKIYTISKKGVSNCEYCNLDMTFKKEYESFSPERNPKIDIETDRFFTSEYIKISNNNPSIKNTQETNKSCILFTIKNNCKDIYKFRIINCPVIKISQTYWKCTAGSFPCENTNDYVIYRSPEDNELSKSPVTLSLYEKRHFYRI
ncbi:MAG: hypothetical protein M3Z01_08355 [Thermoproteota archaeon]|nr:hypothetical protein [Thermoproteota archaeon]